jgi:hypothetical protein
VLLTSIIISPVTVAELCPASLIFPMASRALASFAALSPSGTAAAFPEPKACQADHSLRFGVVRLILIAAGVVVRFRFALSFDRPASRLYPPCRSFAF